MNLLEYRFHSTLRSYICGYAILFAAGTILLWLLMLHGTPQAHTTAVLVTIGWIGVWRYTWQGIHAVRACIYQCVTFPRRRRSLIAGPKAEHGASHVYVVVLSYRMGATVNAEVYGALIRDLKRLGRPATVVACITDEVDRQVLSALGDKGCVRVLWMQQSNLGKRDAIERALALLAGANPPSGAVVTLMDGDTIVEPGTFERTVPLLLADAKLGAVTTNNIPRVAGTNLAREWYRLRMRERHQLMCSMSLSNRLLVLTGRFSVFRAEIALSPGFIATVGHDGYYHSRAGRIGMLTGDDKSTWFYTLQQGWQMIYVPDVAVTCIEKLPHDGFCESTIALMQRYFGNMTRSNLRAIRLMPDRIGVFPWLALVDQRLSPWSSLWGPVLALMLTLFHDGSFIIVYLLWVLVTRTLKSIASNLGQRSFHPFFPFLQFYNQLVGAPLKIYACFHPDQQAWTRQKTGATTSVRALSSTSMMWLSVSILSLGAMLVALV